MEPLTGREREREREEKQRRVRRAEGKEVNGVVFLGSSAPERGERWGPGARGWVVSAIRDLCARVYARVNGSALAGESRKEKGAPRASRRSGADQTPYSIFH